MSILTMLKIIMTFHLRFKSFEGQIHITLTVDTLVRIIMAGNIVAG